MVARLIRTLLAQSLLNAALLLREAGTRLLPEGTRKPPYEASNPSSSDEPDDAPPVTVQVPPEARAMSPDLPSPPTTEEPKPLAGSLKARGMSRSLS